MGASKSLASPDQNVFPGISESASLPSFCSHLSSLDFQRARGGSDTPQNVLGIRLLFFLLTKAFRKRLVERDKQNPMVLYILAAVYPFGPNTLFFLFQIVLDMNSFASVFSEIAI